MTGGGQAARIGLQLVGLVVLARLLGPDQYGVVAMAMAFLGVGEVLRDFGLSTAAVQAVRLTAAQRSNLFWLNSAVGLLLTLAAAASAPAIAAFFDRDELVAVVVALSGMFVLNGMTTQLRADVNRQMRFAALTAVDVSAQAAGLVAGVVLAAVTGTYWALVAQVLAQSAAGLLGFAVVARWRPGRPSREGDVRPLLAFGVTLTATQLLGYVSRNVDAVVVGARFGAEPLGYYNRAYQTVMAPLNQLNAPSTTVALPVLARLREDRPSFDRFLLHGQSIMTVALGWVFAVLCGVADVLVPLVLGDQWAPAVPLVQVFCVAAAIQAVSYATYWVFLAHGRTGANLRFSIVSRAVVIGCVVAGSAFGVIGVAVGYTLGVLLAWPLGLAWIARAAAAPSGAMLRTGVVALLGAVAAGGAARAVSLLLPGGWWSVAGALAAACTATSLVCLVWPAYRRAVRAVLDLARRRVHA